jgi:quercetin dioxygenase-like cupin family protein
VFENSYVRVIDVQIPAGEQTLYHTHDIASVMVYLTRTTNESQTLGESAWTSRTISPGDSRYAAYDKKPLTHQVRNPGPGLFRVYDIELLHHPLFGKAFNLTESQFLRARWQEKMVRSFTLEMVPGAHRAVPPANCACLLVQISGVLKFSSTGEIPRELRPGDFLFTPPKIGFLVTNAGMDPLETVVLELR